ncbi:unnamed protein product [Prorocentrum cordatum]|uniref:Mei2-like C-terminal RNA recognition motif domain-containing protein n=1 Tax=Prorocentrum cordatum TaxID=2364126 RepID=A0ABN9Q6G3_9DINO|nr:unnamed protein product [Polarella glacialis]
MQAVFGTAAPQQHGQSPLAGNLGPQRSSGALCMSEGSTPVPPGCRADGAPERLTSASTAGGAPRAEPLGRWTSGSGVSVAPNRIPAGYWDCSPSPMCGPPDSVQCGRSVHGRRAVAPPEVVSSGGEEETEDFPSKLLLWPDTDDEGEPEVKFAWELWPVQAAEAHRPCARAPPAAVGQAWAPPGPSGFVKHTSAPHSCEGRRQAAGPAAPPGSARRPLGVHAAPVAGQAVAAPATAAGTLPPGIHGVPAAQGAGAAAATPGVAAADAPVAPPTAPEVRARAAQEWKESPRARRADQPRITTLVVRNVPVLISQQDFIDEVNRSGFEEKYDFAWLPRDFKDGSGKGLAFINFKSVAAASAFAVAWHRSSRFSTNDEASLKVRLNVSSADLQGLEANMRKWTCARMARVKNPNLLPFCP